MCQTIEVEVRLYASLRQYCPGLGLGEPLRVQIAEGATAADVLRLLDVPRREMKIAIINSRCQDEDHRLSDGDRVAFFPPIGGG